MEDIEMVDTWVQSPTPRANQQHGQATDDTYIRGISVIAIMKNNSVRIPWTSADKIVMVAHCARYELHLGNYDTLALIDLIQRLGLMRFAEDSTYRDVLIKKLGTALKYRLDHLARAGHVDITRRKPYEAVWKEYTRSWTAEGWDGREDREQEDLVELALV
ncbi:hypothetical protein ACHAPU_010824 [Fusarium lateritium]